MPPPPFHVGSCYLWQDASPFNPSFSLTARILSLTDDEIAVRVIRGYVDGGDPDHATLTLRSAGDKWQLQGSFCYTKDGSHQCETNVWVPKASLEICMQPWWSLLYGCTGANRKSKRETGCAE